MLAKDGSMDPQLLAMLVSNVGGLGLFAYVVWRQLVGLSIRFDAHLTAMETKKDREIQVMSDLASSLAVLHDQRTEGRTPVYGIRPLFKPLPEK